MSEAHEDAVAAAAMRRIVEAFRAELQDGPAVPPSRMSLRERRQAAHLSPELLLAIYRETAKSGSPLAKASAVRLHMLLRQLGREPEAHDPEEPTG